MAIDQVQKLSTGTGTPVIPPIDDYDGASADWEEVEYHARPTGSATVASWSGKPGWVRIDTWPYDEICFMRSGVVEVEDAHGESVRFEAGDAFLIPKGFSGIWRTVEESEKVFVAVPN